MNEPMSVPANAAYNWKALVEAAILEANVHDLSRRISDAQEAVMDRIEDSFQTASQSERQSLINAMNCLRELRRIVQTTPESDVEANARNVIDA